MNDLALPKFLDRRNPSPGDEMTQQHQTKKAEPSQAELEQRAAALTGDIAGIDDEIKSLSTARAAKNKELRSVTSKLVTIKLKSK